MRHLKSFVIGFVALLVLAMVACGGDDDDTTGGGDNQEPTASQPADGNDDGGDDGEEPTDAPDDEPTNAPDGNGAEVDICSLLTSEEVVESVQQDVGEGQSGVPAIGGEACRWESADTVVSAQIEVLGEGGADTYGLVALDTTPYEGIGDQAFITDLPGVITILEGDVLVQVQVINFELDDETRAAVELARLVLERVP